jgi:hypothetical protein
MQLVQDRLTQHPHDINRIETYLVTQLIPEGWKLLQERFANSLHGSDAALGRYVIQRSCMKHTMLSQSS